MEPLVDLDDRWQHDVESCCHVRKVEPLERALAGRAAWVTGVRRVDAPTRANTPVVSHDLLRDIVKINPLATWTDDDMAHVHRARGAARAPADLEGLSVDRVLAVHATRRRRSRSPLRPLGRPRQDRMWVAPMIGALTDELVDEAITIVREVTAECEQPVLLFSGGKDSAVLLHVAVAAFAPARLPFPVCTSTPATTSRRSSSSATASSPPSAPQLLVASVQDSIDRGRVVEEPGPRASRNRLQSVTLLDAIAEHGFDAAFGGGRRDEDKARAKERILSFRDRSGGWDPRRQRPEPWDVLNARVHRGQHLRAFPLSNWTELDVWRYVAAEGLELPSIYYAHERAVVERDGMLLAVGGPVVPGGG